MKKLTALSTLFILLIFVAPIQVSAATNAGVKPGSFFYFFDTTFENVSLFFTFSPEKKAQKALEYADERLTEIEAVAEEKNPDAVKTAIANYESNISLAVEKSKDIKDKGRAETLLNSIADNTSKNQEVLAAVLIKVPEEAREAITRAIELSRKGQEEAAKQIAELKKEVSELKQELENLKGELKDKEEKPEVGDDKKNEQTKAIDKLKNEIESLKKKVGEPSQKETKAEEKKEQSKNSVVTLPSGAVVEMDASGNIVRTIVEAQSPTQTSSSPYIPPTPTSSNSTSTYASSTALTIPTTVVPTPVTVLTPTPILIPTTTPPVTTIPTLTPTPQNQPTSIVQDSFDAYNKGALKGQGGWNSYVNGSNFVVVDTEVFGGIKAIYNQTKADSVITKTGSLLADGKQAVYVKTASRTSWGIHSDGNAQVRVSKNPWASGAQGLAFAAVSFKGDGNVAYYDSVSDKYKNFATYEDGVWTLLEIEWRSSDKTARYRVNSGGWTDWYTFRNASTFSGFDNVGFDFDLRDGFGGGVYFDSLQ